MNINIIEDVITFFEKVLAQNHQIRKQILLLLKKHFNNFKEELEQISSGRRPTEENNGETDADSHRNDDLANLLKFMDRIRFDSGDMWEAVILKEIFDKPVAMRNDDKNSLE